MKATHQAKIMTKVKCQKQPEAEQGEGSESEDENDGDSDEHSVDREGREDDLT